MREITDEDRKRYDRLARAMCAAFISSTTTIPQQQAWDAVRQGAVGDSWILVARLAVAKFASRTDEVTDQDRKLYDRLARAMCVAAGYVSSTTTMPVVAGWDTDRQGPVMDSWILVAKVATELAG